MVADWVVVELEPAGAARSGLPARLAVPREVAERGDPIERVRAAEWARAFVAGHADHELAATLLAMTAAEPFRRLGERLLREERFDEAVPALARAIELTPFDAASRFNLAVALRRAGGDELADGARRGRGACRRDPPTDCCAAASGRRWTSRRARDCATSGRSSSHPETASCSSGSSTSGADAHRGRWRVFWLLREISRRVMRHELASASNDPDQLVALGDRLLGGGHVAGRFGRRARPGRQRRPPGAGLAGLTRCGASGASCRRARPWGARPRSILPASPWRRARAARRRPRATCRGRMPGAGAPGSAAAGSCSATTLARRGPRARRSARTRTPSIWIRRSGRPNTRASPASARLTLPSLCFPVARDPERSITFEQWPGVADDAAPHPGRQMTRVVLTDGGSERVPDRVRKLRR